MFINFRKTSAISLSADQTFANRQKRFQESQELPSTFKKIITDPGKDRMEVESSQPQRIVLKRTHRSSESSSVKMEVAEPNVGLASHLKRNKLDE